MGTVDAEFEWGWSNFLTTFLANFLTTKWSNFRSAKRSAAAQTIARRLVKKVYTQKKYLTTGQKKNDDTGQKKKTWGTARVENTWPLVWCGQTRVEKHRAAGLVWSNQAREDI